MQPLRAVSHDNPIPDEAQMTVNERVELIASIIGCVLSDAFQMQQGLPHTPLHRQDRAIRNVYLSLGRASAHSLLKPDVTLTAESRAVQTACDVLDTYDATDEHPGVRVDPFVRRQRIKTAFLSAIHAYQREMQRAS